MSTFGAPQTVEPQSRGIGVGMVVAICVGVFVAGCFSGYLLGIGQSLYGVLGGDMPGDAGFEVVCDQPTVTVGEEFTFVVSVTDLWGSQRVVSDIDFEGGFVDQIEIVSVDPPVQETYYDVEYVEQVFQQQLSAGATTSFAFTLKATTPGTFHGSVTAYDADYNWTKVPVTIEVLGE